MNLGAVIPVSIALLSLVVSLYVAIRTRRFNDASLRNSARQEHAMMSVNIDRCLVESPELWAIFDSHPLAKARSEEPLVKAKREAFVYLNLTLFEAVHGFYNHVIRQDRFDRFYWAAWHRYIYQFLHQSSEARSIFMEVRTQDIYSASFVAYVSGLLERDGVAQSESCERIPPR